MWAAVLRAAVMRAAVLRAAVMRAAATNRDVYTAAAMRAATTTAVVSTAAAAAAATPVGTATSATTTAVFTLAFALSHLVALEYASNLVDRQTEFLQVLFIEFPDDPRLPSIDFRARGACGARRRFG